MHCEDLLINYGSNGEAVEAIRKSLPQLNVISPLALIIKPIYAVDGSTFVVAA